MHKFWRKTRKNSIRLFVSICAGLNQIPLIREAKKLGFQVIGVDNNLSAPGFLHCDLKIQESIVNSNEIYIKLRELLVDGEINGIMTKSFGSALETTCHLTEKFSLPHFPYTHCMTFIDKKKMKRLFKKNKIKSADYVLINNKFNISSLKKNIFPAVIKPAVGHAKVDVKLLNTVKELQQNLKYYTREKHDFILEKCIAGDEIIAAGLIHDNKFYLVDITDKETTSKPYFVDLMHISPSKHYSLFKKIEAIGQKITDTFDIKKSPLIMEFIRTDNDELFLIEAVPEFGGEFIPDILIPHRTGYNLIREAIRSATGIGFKAPSVNNNKNVVIVKYIIGHEGKLASVNTEGPNKIKNILFFRIFKHIGTRVATPQNNLDRIGVIIAKGRTKEEALATIQKGIDSLHIRIK